jgi:hypothetical protein
VPRTRSRTFDPSLENGQATLVTPSLGIARPRRPGPNPRDLLPLEPAGSHWMVGGPNEQRVVELFTSWRAENVGVLKYNVTYLYTVK